MYELSDDIHRMSTIRDREMIDPTLCLARIGKYYMLCLMLEVQFLLRHYDLINRGKILRNLSKNNRFSRLILIRKEGS